MSIVLLLCRKLQVIGALGILSRANQDEFRARTQSGIFNILLGSQKVLPSANELDRPLWLAYELDGKLTQPFA